MLQPGLWPRLPYHYVLTPPHWGACVCEPRNIKKEVFRKQPVLKGKEPGTPNTDNDLPPAHNPCQPVSPASLMKDHAVIVHLFTFIQPHALFS